MQCINRSCARELEEQVRFCPYCRTSQPEIAVNAKSDLGLPPISVDSNMPSGQLVVTEAVNTTGNRPSDAKSTVGLILRASDNIWDFEEPEGTVTPGAKRPLFVIDEQVTHLAHTDRKLTPEELLNRMTTIIRTQQVPVRVDLVQTCWARDQKNSRPRLVASLDDQSNSSIKMIFGVDYLGKWASISMLVGIEPDVVPIPPQLEMPRGASWTIPTSGVILVVLGILISLTIVGAIIGIPLALWGAWIIYNSNQKHQSKLLYDGQRAQEDYARRQREEHERRERAAMEKLFRTYKVDDTRLFTAAMQVVYKVVVDDIVSSGGEVVRVTGGRGGFIDNDGIASLVPSRSSDAAMGDV